MGYYDNQADPKIVKNNQWGWLTTFSHLGLQWPVNEEVRLIAQYLTGNTLMQTRSGSRDLVNNDYSSFYLMLVRQAGANQYSFRVEDFEVQDLDQITSDNNNESGNALTLSYRHQLSSHLFSHLEYLWINSDRPSREVFNQVNDYTEQQFTVALRYYF